jgi:uncharacterized protein
VTRRTPWAKDPARTELLRVYAEADALAQGASCGGTHAATAADARCCHFGILGREPYVTAIELMEARHAIAAGGGLGTPARKLPLAPDPGTCPLLSREGRCTIYASRPLGCRTFFCRGHEPQGSRPTLLALARRIRDLSERAFPRAEGPRPLSCAVASPSSSEPKKAHHLVRRARIG